MLSFSFEAKGAFGGRACHFSRSCPTEALSMMPLDLDPLFTELDPVNALSRFSSVYITDGVCECW